MLGTHPHKFKWPEVLSLRKAIRMAVHMVMAAAAGHFLIIDIIKCLAGLHEEQTFLLLHTCNCLSQSAFASGEI